MTEYCTEAARKTPVDGRWDVLVIGGGAGGIAAALSARRLGSSVCLIDKAILLGGLATRGYINWLEPYCDGAGHRVLDGIPWEMFQLALRYGHDSLPNNWQGTGFGPPSGRLGSWFSPELFMLAVEEELRTAGVKLLLDTVCAAPWMEEKRCVGVMLESIEGRHALRAKTVIDATGTCEIFAKAGAPTRCGENYLTLRAYGTDESSLREAVERGDPFLARRRLRVGAKLDGTGQPAGVPTTAGVTAQQVTDFVLASRSLLWEKVKKQPRRSRDLVNLPDMPQLRTIRHIMGKAVFTGEEDQARQADSIGVIPDFQKPGRLYELPYGCLFAPGCEGLLTCGRTISASGWGWHASRVLGAAFLTGQAAGTAAYLACAAACDASQVATGLLQETLRAQGVHIHIDELPL